LSSISSWVIGIIKSFSFHYKSALPRMNNLKCYPGGGSEKTRRV
jgi:hypothetical protein